VLVRSSFSFGVGNVPAKVENREMNLMICELQRDWARAKTAQQCRELLFAVEGR
jgi:hypothetical protein